jgi:hypothetical protein
LRARDLMRPVRGVRALADADLVARCRALLLHRSDFAFSHATAARLYGAPLPHTLENEERIHVTVEAPLRPPQIAGVSGHVARGVTMIDLRGLPLTGPEQTWLALAADLHREQLVALGDYFLAQRLTTPDSLASALESGAGRRGMAIARLALPLVRMGSESPGESVLRVILSDAGMAPPFLNYRIHTRDGSFVARVDLAYPELRLALEYEGDHHRTDRGQWHKDIDRQSRLEDLGWRVIRVTAADVAAPASLLARLQRAVLGE